MADALLEPSVAISDAPPVARFSLRIGDPAAASGAFGAPLPPRIGEVTRRGPRAVLCVGPDEWVVKTELDDAAALSDAFATLATPHSLVDVSAREVTLRLRGPDVLDVLALGCPRDLRRFAVGRGMRTVFDGVTVVLWRLSESEVDLDVWRSYAPHVRHLLGS